jgi:hypothetical protein
MKKPDYTHQKKLEWLALQLKLRKEQEGINDSPPNAIVRK